MDKQKINFTGMDIIYQRIRDSDNKPIGMFVGFILPDKDSPVYIGWSKCKVNGSPGTTDRFDKSVGINIAIGRAMKLLLREEYIKQYNGNPEKRQVDIKWDLIRFIIRCKRYFGKRYQNIVTPRFAQRVWDGSDMYPYNAYPYDTKDLNNAIGNSINYLFQ
jgi:hypothetical protein